MADSSQGKGDPVRNFLSPGPDNVKLIYILYLASVVVGITMLIGLVIAYLNRGAAAGTWVESHYTYQIRTFWIGLLYGLICVVLMIIGIGFLLIVAVLVWGVVRCIRGLQWSSSGQPVPNPNSWLV